MVNNRLTDIQIPKNVNIIIETLEENGHEAYAVGGCVRDSLLGKTPKDWDITTSADPYQVKELFKRTIDTGIKHGTVTIMIGSEGYEVTTYRIDGEYKDGRHPKEVAFTKSLFEDLKRRDFTINAMAYNKRAGIVDLFDGILDLENRVIKCVGDPVERFSEDALRILRAVRFSGVLDFQIETKTREAVNELSHTLIKISRERIQVELEKLLMCDHPEKISDLYETDIMKWIFPEDYKEKDHNKDNYELMIELIKRTEPDHYVRWAIFCTFISVNNPLKSLKFDNKTISICKKLIQYKDHKLSSKLAELRKTIVLIGEDIFMKYYISYREVLGNVEKELLDEIKKNYTYIIENNHCLSMKALAVKGNDMKEIGINEGLKIGEILNELFEIVLEDSSLNEKNKLIEIAKKLKNK